MTTLDTVPWLAELTSPEVAHLRPAEWLVVWPVASLEQHGPHLPLGTDALILEAVVHSVRNSLGVALRALFLPMLQIGKSPEHLAFPGTISLRASTLLSIAEDIAFSCVCHGFRRLVFLNGHGGNTALLQGIAQDLRQKYGAVVYNIDLWPTVFTDELIQNTYPDLLAPEVHAASAETSMMQYLRPELVGELPMAPPAQVALQATATTERLGQIPWGWLSQDFEAAGVIGDTTSASVESGGRLLTAAATRLGQLLMGIPGGDCAA